MMQLSLVSFYGEKPDSLSELISRVQNTINNRCGEDFNPYTIEQIHGTLVSLERLDEAGFINKNYAQMRNFHVEMDFEGLLHYFRGTKILPVKVQIGGFENRDYGFLSRQQTPYSRTFSIQGRFANVLGWPCIGNDSDKSDRMFKVSTTLGDLRKELESFNILHSYHSSETDYDNDFYFRIGIFDENAVLLNYQITLEEEIRELLSKRPPLFLTLSPENIFLVFYSDQRLPLESSTAWSIVDPMITPDFIKMQFQGI